MQSDLKEIVTIMEELENEETEVNTSSVTDSKCSSGSLEAQECDVVISEYASLYKTTKTPANQEKRRKQLLEEMKLRRNQAVNQKRGLLELLSIDDNDLDYMEDQQEEFQEEPMDIVTKHKPRKRRRRKNIYTNQLMLSEWFTEIPCDLESQWLVKLCPVGVRNLVVAQYGITRAFSKSGLLLSTIQSELPGGNEHSNTRVFTVLDCIYSPKLKCYYILDVIAWRNCALQLSEADLRFFWLKSKLDETPELKEVTGFNEHSFYEIESFPAELPLIQGKLSQPYTINDQVVPLDGILFYHRATHYIHSQTPLVGWLKPFMVPEMLQIPVDKYFMDKLPNNYKSMKQYLNTSPKNVKKKKQGYNNCDNETLSEVEMEI